MSQKNKKSRQSLPPMNFNPWMMMGPHMMNWQEQMGMMPTTSGSSSTVTKSAATATAMKFPCDGSDSDSLGDDDDFQPSNKKVKSSTGSEESTQAKEDTSQAKGKLGRRSRDSASLLARRTIRMKKIVSSYPKISITDSVAFEEADECAKCRIYIGRFALTPCGHGKYCVKCLSELKKKAELSMTPGSCFKKGCHTVVKSWFVLNKLV